MSKSVDVNYKLSKAAITGGSKSFRLASLLLDKKSQRGAYLLYRWCRHCDDQVDEANNQEEAQSLLQLIKKETQKGLIANLETSTPSPYSGLHELTATFKIPQHHFFEMIEGFEQDVSGTMIHSLDDLLRYCYHVAGVVGLMMSPILKVRDPEALLFADQLGRAMQLTNICRDVGDDFRNDRIYIPRVWLEEESIKPYQLLSQKNENLVYQLVLRLLDKADSMYDEGRRGLSYLPFRAGWSISVASYLYQGIGIEIRRIGPSALKKRTVLEWPQKLKYFLLGSQRFLTDRLRTSFKNFTKEAPP
ncbi:MAG: hypothetical protein RJB66_114 [Pseudomonadota bacterium]|jgi:phytoene synthase